jgi:NAD(P)-dependent dehydrogenase (short-subunit alcohol dehydrogenase family)
MELKLKDRIAFVTGSSRGIGLAIAEAFAREGVHLALFGRDEALCAELARKLRERHQGLRAGAIQLDFEYPQKIKPAVEAAVSQLGGVDILVNCAGGSRRGGLNDISDDDWERFFRVKPLGLIRMTREAAPYLKRSDQARVINIAGNRGREPRTSMMGGPINLGTLSATKALANELGPHGITVNAVSPGFTRTRRWPEFLAATAHEMNISVEEAEKYLVSEIPMGRIVTPEDVADLTVFLASARAAMITGTAINVDGGNSRSI